MTDYPICSVWYQWRTQTDKDMQNIFCPIAQTSYTDYAGVRKGWDIQENFCESCNRSSINDKRLWNEIKYKKD